MVSVGLIAGLACDARGQTVEQQGLVPVDQTIEDTDPLGVSLRQREGGLNIVGEQGTVFRRLDSRPGDPRVSQQRSDKLYYISNGVVAEFDRSDYLKVTDTERGRSRVFQLIPPNTVFYIGKPPAPEAQAEPQPAYLPHQIDGRFTPRGPVRIEDLPTRRARSSAEREQHGEIAMHQRAVVLQALQRIAQPPAR